MARPPCELSGYCERGLDHEGPCGPLKTDRPLEQQLAEVLAPLVAERDRYKLLLSNLLARIHRDGGQYETLHGIENAAADADRIVADLFAKTRDTAERQRAACAEQAKKHTVVVDPWGARSSDSAERAILATPLVTEE